MKIHLAARGFTRAKVPRPCTRGLRRWAVDGVFTFEGNSTGRVLPAARRGHQHRPRVDDQRGHWLGRAAHFIWRTPPYDLPGSIAGGGFFGWGWVQQIRPHIEKRYKQPVGEGPQPRMAETGRRNQSHFSMRWEGKFAPGTSAGSFFTHTLIAGRNFKPWSQSVSARGRRYSWERLGPVMTRKGRGKWADGFVW